ncbi:MAG: hypothetical protein IPI07_02900 [Flavobacteriales bacterium]|nr:hypothetical protein [Flavobacteriales bacterium]
MNDTTTPTPTPKRSFGSVLKRTAWRLLLVVGALLIAWVLFLYYASYSEGSRSGMVIKLSKRGMVFKTWEGQMNLQTFRSYRRGDQRIERGVQFQRGNRGGCALPRARRSFVERRTGEPALCGTLCKAAVAW